MTGLWFIVPAYGRVELTRICLGQLRRVCDWLAGEGVDASAVVIADDENLETARDLGFGTVRRDNQFLSRRFNDGIQLACDATLNPRPADFVVPLGSDDWIDPAILLPLPDQRTVVGFQKMTFVREDGAEIVARLINYPGGAGIRIYPRAIVERLSYRPADEDRKRGCDTSILTNLQYAHDHDLKLEHRDLHPCQLVDWKSPDAQLNRYTDLRRHRGQVLGDPFEQLADWYPSDALEQMQQHYARQLVAA